MNLKSWVVVLVAVMAIIAAGNNNAFGDAINFGGQSVRAQYYYDSLSSPYGPPSTFTVGAGIEANDFPTGYSYFDLDLTSTNITAKSFNLASTWSFAPFNGFVISDYSNSIDAITGVTVAPSTNMVGFDPSRISFDANNVYVNWQGLNFNASTIVSLDVSFSGASSSPESVPLPGVAVAGVALMGGTRLSRFRRRRAA
jgi:hypothetical protein